MKQKFTKLVCLAFCLILCENVTAQQTMLAIDNQTPGTLSDMINEEDQKTVENLKISGYINGSDINFIKTLSKMKTLDLTDVNIIKGGDQIYLYSLYSAGYYYPSYLLIEENNVFYNSLFWSFHVDKITTPKTLKEEKLGSYVHINADTVIINSRAGIEISQPQNSYGYPIYYNKVIEIGEGVDSVGINHGSSGTYTKINKLIIPSTLKKLKITNWAKVKRVFSKIEHPETLNAEDFKIDYFNDKVDTLFIPQGTYSRYQNSIFKDVKVIVEMNAPSSISLSSTSMKLYINDNKVLYATTTPSDVYYKELKWESNDESVAVVNQHGEVTAVSPGIVDITVSSVKNPEARAICRVTVCEHVTGIQLVSDKEIVNIGKPIILTANTLPLGTTDNEVTWASSDEDIATVNENGKVTGIKPGSCIIKAKSVDGGFEAQCNVTVVQPAETITLNNESTSLIVGKTETLTANILPDNTTDKTILWSSSNINVATVDANGMITGKKAGECTITATSLSNPNVTTTCKVTVIQPVTGITLSESTYKLKAIGENIQLTATVLPDDATNKKVNWNCPNNTVCIVSNGNVVAVGYGTAVIIATTEDGGFLAICTVTVEDTSGIIDIKSEHNENLPTYDTMGRRVQELKKGQLYIRQGKKFVLK